MRYKWPLITFLFAVVFIAAAGFFKYNVRYKVLIKASLFDLSGQLSDMRIWANWDNVLFPKSAAVRIWRNCVMFRDGSRITLMMSYPASFQLEVSRSGISSVRYITLVPVGRTDSTEVEWITSQSGFSWFWQKALREGDVPAQLNKLKTFAENQAHI